jgi:hypothetical protein
MALGLTDQQMALVLIIGTGLKVPQQRRLLRRLRQQAQLEFDAQHANDPKPSPQLDYYRRKRLGLVRITFTVDPDDASTFLRGHGVPVFAETGAALSQSFQNLIAKSLYFGRYRTGED